MTMDNDGMAPAEGLDTGQVARITIDLPTPAHTVSDRGFKYLDEFGAHERSHADRAMVEVDGLGCVSVEEAEQFALSVLWLVRNHYHGEGLDSEVCSCGGAGWVDDENWSPEFAGQQRARHDGIIPCGFCNEEGARG